MADMPMEQGASAAGGEGQGGFTQLVGNILKGMAILGQGLEQSGVPEEGLAELESLMSAFDSFAAKISGGGGEGAPQGKTKAVPMQESQGKPVGPAGV